MISDLDGLPCCAGQRRRGRGRLAVRYLPQRQLGSLDRDGAHKPAAGPITKVRQSLNGIAARIGYSLPAADAGQRWKRTDYLFRGGWPLTLAATTPDTVTSVTTAALTMVLFTDASATSGRRSRELGQDPWDCCRCRWPLLVAR